MAPKFGKASPVRKGNTALRAAGNVSLSPDRRARSESKPKSPLSQLYEQKPFGFQPSTPRSMSASQTVASLSQDTRLQEMSSYVSSRGGCLLPALGPNPGSSWREPRWQEDSLSPTATLSPKSPQRRQSVRATSQSFFQRSAQKTPSQTARPGAFGYAPGYETREEWPMRRVESAASLRGRVAGFAGSTGGSQAFQHPEPHVRRISTLVEETAEQRPSTRERLRELRSEGLQVQNKESRRLAKMTAADGVEAMCKKSEALPALRQTFSMPELHKPQESEASHRYFSDVDRWLRRLVVVKNCIQDVNISHKSLPSPTARNQIVSHMEKVHQWFDRSKQVATNIHELAGAEKPLPAPPLQQAGIYLPEGAPAQPGSLYWEKPSPKVSAKRKQADGLRSPKSEAASDGAEGSTDVGDFDLVDDCDELLEALDS
ncbi:unnamed protein product [Effrenium voratum]|uniref:Uncharacterized protein n=1 Tax=Effrenium voratum TaxID=2562239 RepID=A0AA36HN51_9DINO|nr:unnamed protein product [Effrenium voratum]